MGPASAGLNSTELQRGQWLLGNKNRGAKLGQCICKTLIGCTLFYAVTAHLPGEMLPLIPTRLT